MRRPLCRVYLAICKRCGPRRLGKRLTVSAWLWIREKEGGGWFWRTVVDDWFLIYRGQDEHCKNCFQRETA
jgi:hypothetical protein